MSNLSIDNAVPKFDSIQRTNKAIDAGSGITYNEAGYTYNQIGQTYGGIYEGDVEKQVLKVENL